MKLKSIYSIKIEYFGKLPDSWMDIPSPMEFIFEHYPTTEQLADVVKYKYGSESDESYRKFNLLILDAKDRLDVARKDFIDDGIKFQLIHTWNRYGMLDFTIRKSVVYSFDEIEDEPVPRICNTCRGNGVGYKEPPCDHCPTESCSANRDERRRCTLSRCICDDCDGKGIRNSPNSPVKYVDELAPYRH